MFLPIIDKHYPADTELRRILLTHSRLVADKALAIVDSHPALAADRPFVEEAAMLHDIGIFRCDAPAIHCHGTEPYIRHGAIGGELLLAEGHPRHARVCERHTGAGLPGHLPETIEEKIICYADKFFSKTNLTHEKTLEEAVRSLSKFGDEGVARFLTWAELFETR